MIKFPSDQRVDDLLDRAARAEQKGNQHEAESLMRLAEAAATSPHLYAKMHIWIQCSKEALQLLRDMKEIVEYSVQKTGYSSSKYAIVEITEKDLRTIVPVWNENKVEYSQM